MENKPKVTITNTGTLRVKSSDILQSRKSADDFTCVRAIIGHQEAMEVFNRRKAKTAKGMRYLADK